MDHDNWLQILLGLLGLGITVTLTLMGIIFSWLKSRIDKNEQKSYEDISALSDYVNTRLRSLGHEDREIRGMIENLWKVLLDDRKRKKGD